MRPFQITILSLSVFILAALIELFNHSRHERNPGAVKWTFSGINGSVIKFRNGKQFNTRLYDLEYLGQVENGAKAPFLIFSGRDCDECDENVSIYIHSPSDGDITVANGANRYEYPGTEKDYDNDSLLYKARAFFGQVLPGIKGVIWYQQQLMEDRSFRKSVFLARLNDDVIKDTVLKDTADLKLTLKLLKDGQCREIKGVDNTSEP